VKQICRKHVNELAKYVQQASTKKCSSPALGKIEDAPQSLVVVAPLHLKTNTQCRPPEPLLPLQGDTPDHFHQVYPFSLPLFPLQLQMQMQLDIILEMMLSP